MINFQLLPPTELAGIQTKVMVDDPCMFTNVDNKSCALISSIFSSPGPKGHVSFCHHFASVVVIGVVVRI
jgi:hypothetical protein